MNKVKKITLIIIICMIFGEKSYARYIKTEKLKVEQKIARPILKIQEGESIKINTENKEGYYEFSVKNFDSEQISDVNYLYTIQIIFNSQLSTNPDLELYDSERKITLINMKTNPIFIKGNEKIEQKYRLKINYNEVEGGKDIIDKVQIKINAEQEKSNV